MKKTYGYVVKEREIFFYKSKNSVVELAFETHEELLLFRDDFVAFEESNYEQSNNNDVLSFWSQYRYYLLNNLSEKVDVAVAFLGFDANQIAFLSPLLEKRGFTNITFDTYENSEVVVVSNATSELYEKLLNLKKDILSIDLTQGFYATIGPFHLDNETSCQLCMNQRFKINNLLDDVFDESMEVESFHHDELFHEQLLYELVQYLYLELSKTSMGLLHNTLMNFSFVEQKREKESLLLFPNCLCQR